MSAPISLPPRYRFDRPLAAGGMAAVYAAHDTLLDRPVAVKVLAEHLTADPDARRRFQREARAAAGLSSHRAVVTIFDVGEHEGRSFMVMELRRGGTIADVLRGQGRVEPRRALGWLRDVADALDTAHARGIVHRDIKPANLLLDEHGRVAVADFGIARLAWEDQFTATGQVLGTAAYISPEQATGEPATPASDRYALAVVAFELLTGSRPFPAEHFAAQARAHVEDEPPAASERAPGLPRAFDALLRRGMAKRPEDRWPSATAFVGALERVLEGDDAEAAAPATTTTRVMEQASAPAGAGAAYGAAARAAQGRREASPPPAGPATRGPGAGPATRRAGRRLGPSLALAGVLVLLAVAGIALGAALLDGGGSEGGRTAAPPPEQTDGGGSEPAGDPDRAVASPAAGESARTPEPTRERASAAGDPSTLNARGFDLFRAGRYGEAVPHFEQAVEQCGASRALDPCGYALYNLGASLRRSGRPDEAIPILERRLERFGDNESGDVRRELEQAYEDAGEGGEGEGKNRGKGKKGD